MVGKYCIWQNVPMTIFKASVTKNLSVEKIKVRKLRLKGNVDYNYHIIKCVINYCNVQEKEKRIMNKHSHEKEKEEKKKEEKKAAHLPQPIWQLWCGVSVQE